MLDLFAWDAGSGKKIPTVVGAAAERDLAATRNWQTNWTTPFAAKLPNKVVLRREDDGELLGLMSYELDEKELAVEILYVESARHSNANLLPAGECVAPNPHREIPQKSGGNFAGDI